MPNFSKFVGVVKAGRMLQTYIQTYRHTDRGYLTVTCSGTWLHFSLNIFDFLTCLTSCLFWLLDFFNFFDFWTNLIPRIFYGPWEGGVRRFHTFFLLKTGDISLIENWNNFEVTLKNQSLDVLSEIPVWFIWLQLLLLLSMLNSFF